MRQHPQQAPSQQAVRVGRFEETMDRFERELNHSMANKTATLLTVFHVREIQPLIDRIAELERRTTPWYRRWYHAALHRAALLRAWWAARWVVGDAIPPEVP